MATIQLGKIKQVWRDAWSSGNNYAVDDLVSHTDQQITSTYIAVQASTSGSPQAPSTSGTINTSYWNLVAKGVADPIPSQSGNSGKALITDGTNASWGTAGKLLNIYSTHPTTSTHTTSSSFQDCTNFTLTVTASSSTSKFLIMASANMECDGSANRSHASIFKDGSTNLGHSAGGLTQMHEYYYPGSQDQEMPATMHVVDTPGDTNAHTYNVKVRLNGGTRAGWNGVQYTTKGSLIILEIA